MAYEYDYIGFIVAVLIVIGGAIGYFKAGIYFSIIYVIDLKALTRTFQNRFRCIADCWSFVWRFIGFE